MPRLRSVALAALTLVLAGCGSTPGASLPTTSATPSPGLSRSPSPSPSGDVTTFTSTANDYTLDIPADWTQQPASMRWTGGDIDHTADYADRFTDAQGNVYFVLGARTALASASYAEEHLAWLSSERGCAAPTRRTSTTVDGATAVRVSVHCPEGVFGPTLVSKVIAVHDGNALILTAFSPDTRSDAMPSLDVLASSLRWLRH